MSGIGPTLPPHPLSKRKRQENDDRDGNETDRSTDSTTLNGKTIRIAEALTSASPNDALTQAKRLSARNDLSPTEIEPISEKNVESKTTSPGLPFSSQALQKKVSKIVGPSLPPAEILDRPSIDNQEDSDSDDDDFGPALPGTVTSKSSVTDEALFITKSAISNSSKTSRDQWMLAPPTSKDRTSQIDPSKMKNRGFTSGSRAAPKSDGDMSLWTESPEEKRKRLEDELLGVRKVGQSEFNDAVSVRKEVEAALLTKKVKAYNVSYLY